MLGFRFANENDVDILFDWANDETARQNSYNPHPIIYTDHVKWYDRRLNSDNTRFYIFTESNGSPVGQVRIEKNDTLTQATISISVDKQYRGKGYSIQMLQQASSDYIKLHPDYTIIAYIFKSNPVSYKSFLKAGFTPLKEEVVKGVDSYILSYCS